MTSRGISVDKLAEISNIPKRYLIAMIEGDIDHLPATPYARGYLGKIASLFDIDPYPLYESFQQVSSKTSAGKNDHLPHNRFANPENKKQLTLVIAGVLSLVVIIIIGGRINSFLGIPSIEVNIPEKVGANNFLETHDRLITIKGDVNPKDSLAINSESIAVDSSGHFEKEVVLNSGINIFEIKVKRFLGREKTITRQVFYNDESGSSVITVDSTENNPVPSLKTSESKKQ